MKTFLTLFCTVLFFTYNLSAQLKQTSANVLPSKNIGYEKRDPNKVTSAIWRQVNEAQFSKNIRALLSVESVLFASMPRYVYKSVDCGNTWSELPENEFTFRMILESKGNLFGLTNGFARSSDQGNSWENIKNLLPAGSIQSLIAKDSSLYISTAAPAAGVHRSTDNGNTWVKLSTVSMEKGTITLQRIDTVLFSLTQYLISDTTSNTEFHKSTDNGNTWTAVSNDIFINNNYITSITANKSYLFVTTLNGGYRCGIDGANWQKINFDLPVMYIGAIQDADSLLIMSSSNGIFVSRDNGVNWKSMNEGLPATNIISMAKCDQTLFVGLAESTGLWAIDIDNLKNVSSVEENSKMECLQSQLSCYPNPATNTLTIDRTTLQFPENTPVQYALSTLLGGKVMEFDNSELKFTVQLDGLVSGVYLLTAESGGNRAAVMVTVVE